MPQFYPSISPELRAWALRQPIFFVASAPLRGKHVNLSPKGLPDACFAILGPNEAAYIDATGSGNETICHLRENGRLTVMFCSFDAAPRILRFFCTGTVIEWDQPEFGEYVARMGGGKRVVGARAVIRLDVFKVQTSCGYGVPQLALTLDPDTNEPKPYFKDRETIGHWASNKVEKGQLRAYQQQWNARSLDGLPGLWSAVADSGRSVWVGRARNWMRRHGEEIELVKTSVLWLGFVMLVLSWMGYA
ncbi:pyridoxamine 5'-phosphate oxidase family protein [Aspergillus clavatus NRRL 1]|uniref:Pyridoxamine phosphate oxidase family protein n=1 Tax=Aspergillus clavatus (strain ATCC 1007 / CBS 513.65 / DSM 816 / NCTC 3887 / NRRL 1 / QM 1276 / 107) TaxID=344612 RepID=A1CU28_ASPCL|nr:pyridoxamine phosphate oxidase family protein [Aspergillus clavatus NRRL 1]EAW06815.1 pyridoxamine phosphate oxidase family protein [Aspergillus clavatus NRRL 1]